MYFINTVSFWVVFDMVPEVQTSDTSVVTWHLVDLSRTQVHFLNHQSATGPGAKPQVQQQEVCLCPKHFDIECSQTPGRVFSVGCGCRLRILCLKWPVTTVDGLGSTNHNILVILFKLLTECFFLKIKIQLFFWVSTHSQTQSRGLH